MSKSSYTNKPSDSKGYAAGYEIFLKRTNFRNVVIDTYKKNFESEKDLIGNDRETFRVLDIGCGNGAMTERFISCLVGLIPSKSIEVVLVEPASDAALEAAGRLAKYSSCVKTENMTAEDYAGNIDKEKKPFVKINSKSLIYFNFVSKLSEILLAFIYKILFF